MSMSEPARTHQFIIWYGPFKGPEAKLSQTFFVRHQKCIHLFFD
jgi:hypothetical protein